MLRVAKSIIGGGRRLKPEIGWLRARCIVRPRACKTGRRWAGCGDSICMWQSMLKVTLVIHAVAILVRVQEIVHHIIVVQLVEVVDA